jgi:nitrogen fixation protein NifU and related proteins
MFNDTIIQHFTHPTHANELSDATHSVELSDAVCGDRVKVQMRVKDGHIERAGYRGWGCATSLATGNAFCQFIETQPTSFLAKATAADMDALLGALEPSQMHCRYMLYRLFQAAAREVSP